MIRKVYKLKVKFVVMSAENRIKEFLDEEEFIVRTKSEIDRLFLEHGGEGFLEYVNWFFCPESQDRNIQNYYARAAQIVGEQCIMIFLFLNLERVRKLF